MTDHEITQLIAEKVMGWQCWSNPDDEMSYPPHNTIPIFYFTGGPSNVCRAFAHNMADNPFSPVVNDADCMKAWEKFNIGRGTTIEHTETGWHACVTMDYERATKRIYSTDPDRRRAMCVCMARTAMRLVKAGKDNEASGLYDEGIS